MLRQVDGRWALVSKKTGRPLAYYKGEGKPSDEWVAKQEKRIQFFKHGLGEEKKVPHPDILPKAGAGQDGTDTLVQSYKNDTPGEGKKLKRFKDYAK